MTPLTADRLAARTVTGVMAVMVAATAAATAVGFWLSYNGLHDFAVRAGLSGAEAWMWPASVDLFIVAGEAGVTISALRRERDWGAWVYLAIGFAASVTGNILHVHPGELPWPPYAVAAVPPMAAMAALAALLRIVYRLAIDRAMQLEAAPEDMPKTAPETIPDAVPEPPEAVTGTAPATPPQAPLQIVPKPSRKPSPAAAKRMTPGDLAPYVQTVLETSPGTTPSDLMKSLHIGREKATEALRLARKDRLHVMAQ